MSCCFRLCLSRLGQELQLTYQTRHLCNYVQTKKAFSRRPSRYPDFEVSSKEFEFVERLIGREQVPDPPAHTSYPTPSGWLPPADPNNVNTAYFVNRTKNHMLPVYFRTTNGGSRKLTLIRKVEGDIWAFEADVRRHLEEFTRRPVVTQVHEIGRYVQVKGQFEEQVAKFLVEKGF